MELYFSPMSSSLAARAALYEADAAGEVRFIEVDRKSKRTSDGGDVRDVFSLGLVPILRLDDGTLLSENVAVLQYIAERYPGAGLAPRSDSGRLRLQQWLSFIATELHKAFFAPLLDPNAPEGTRAHTLKKFESRLRFLEAHLTGREYLLDGFSVADVYLATILNWTLPTRVDLSQWPAIKSYHERLRARPGVAKAFQEEFALYQAELARNKAA